ncbi:hypothetical protein BC939DRAFT_532521 [Gamsiella multidivaricata]|uniref:uncharacterized protein n=1 Tax=Gamsiella multidivaricata TaxID=101098 RepID=UPI00221F48BA|nr:uncharacterized protein BC939DRAFT_532521 [Gamsiella multidivaricata]KAI7817774.1 hypothetical protein BC939DRAFT_532521 [Gamsiella multidivaricata]
MMILNFLFSGILMLNVLIGFRESHDCFPEKIYFTASRKEAKEYQKATERLGEEESPASNVIGISASADVSQDVSSK